MCLLVRMGKSRRSSGSIANILATAAKLSRKLTENRSRGRKNNIRKAAAKRVLKEKGCLPAIKAVCAKPNITAALQTEGLKPVSAA